MHIIWRSPIWLLLVFGTIATLSASPPVIGAARSRGEFMIDNASVPGNATILDGTALRTMGQPSTVRLKTGQSLILGPASKATIYQNRLVLESGVAELDGASAYRVEAGKLSIGGSSPDANILVTIDGSRQIQVAATSGGAEVRNFNGLLVARVLPGTALQLRTAEDNNSADLTGRVTSQDGKFFLTDETTKVKWEVRGNNLPELVGKRVHIKGSITPPAQSGELGVVTVASATVVKAAAVAGAAGAGGAATGAATAGGLSATMIALIVGGAAAATVGGLAAAGTFSSSSTSR